MFYLMWHCVVLEEKYKNLNFNISNITEIIIQTQKCLFFLQLNKHLFSEENKDPRIRVEAKKVAGFAKSKQRKFVYLVLKIAQKMSFLNKISSAKVHSAPLRNIKISKSKL